MSDTPQLTNVTTVLLARMESHPQDFDYGGRFFDARSWLDKRCLGVVEAQGTMNLLPKEDQELLIEKWRQKQYAVFEKEIMEKVFDETWDDKKVRNTGQGFWLDPRTALQGGQTLVYDPMTDQHRMMQAQNQAQNLAAQGAQASGLSGIFGGIFK